MKDSTRVLVALGLGLGLGAAIAASGNPTLLRAADLVEPIGSLWVGAIRMTIIPLAVSLLITGVAGGSDLRSIGRLGRRTLVVFVSLSAILAVIMTPLIPAIFGLLPLPVSRPPLPPGAAEAAAQVAQSDQAIGFAAWLTSLIPSNPIAAAATGAMLPLLVFTILLGIAISQSPPAARDTLVGFFRALGDAMLVLVRWIVALAPVGVFGLVLPLAAKTGLGLAGAVGFYIAVYALTSVLGAAILYPTVALAGRVPIRRFARAVLPPQLIAFSSSSSVASLPALIESADRDLGIAPRVSGFVLPLAVSVFKVAGPVSWTVGSVFVAWFYGIPLGVPQLVIVAVASVFLAFAAPGVPRGAFLMLAPLFLALGLPVEGVGILIAVDAIPDLFATVLNVTGDLAAAAIVARGEPDGFAASDRGAAG